MTKEKYLAALETALQSIPKKRRAGILEDYAQRIDRLTAAGYAEPAAVAAQGSPAETAAAILSAKTKRKGRGAKIALWILLGLVGLGLIGAGVVLTARLLFRAVPTTFYVNLPGGARVEHKLPEKDIQNLDVQWAGGDIRVEPSPDEKTHLIESGTFDGQNQQLNYDLSDGTLFVDYGNFNYVQKDLVVQLPAAQLETLSLHTNGGDVEVTDVEARTAELVSGAGDMEFSGDADTLSVQTGAGDIDVIVPKNASSVTLNTGAGDIDAAILETAASVTLDIGAGDIDLTFSKCLSFRLEARTGVGEIDVSVPGAKETSDSVWQAGDGACEIAAKTGVGDISAAEE